MLEMKKIAVSAAVLSWLMLAGCGTNSRIPEIREASFNREATPAAADATHEVRLGETLYSIAWRYNTDYRDLARWNNIQPPYMLNAGQKLRLSAPLTTPAANAVQVKPLSGSDSMSAATSAGDDSWLVSAPEKTTMGPNGQNATGGTERGNTVTAPAGAPTMPSGNSAPVPSSSVAPAAKPAEGAPASSTGDVSSSAAAKTTDTATSDASSATSAWLWPTKGTVVGRFSSSSAITPGLDIAGQKGQPVLASRSGTVVYAGNGVRGYGNLVIIKHDDHFLSAYAHNDTLKVKTNDTVKAGQIIATLGDTEADRAKLHFEIRQDSQSKDPQQFLPRS